MKKYKHWGFTLSDYSEEELQRIQSLYPSQADRVVIGIDSGQSDSSSLLDCYVKFKIQKKMSTVQNIIPEEAHLKQIYFCDIKDHIARLSSCKVFEKYGGDDKEPANKKPSQMQVLDEDNEEEEEDSDGDGDDIVDCKTSSVSNDRRFHWIFTLRDYSEEDLQRIQSLHPSQADRVVIGIDPGKSGSPSLLGCCISFKRRKRLGTVQKLVSEEACWEGVYHRSVEDHIARLSSYAESEEYGADDIADCNTSSVSDDRKYLLHWGFTLRDYSEEDLQRIQSLHPSEADRVVIGIDPGKSGSPSLLGCCISFKRRKRLGTVQKLISEEARWEGLFSRSVEDHIARLSSYAEFEEYGGDDKEPTNKKPRKMQVLEEDDEEEEEHSDSDDLLDYKASSLNRYHNWSFTLSDYSEEDLQRVQSLYPSEADRVVIGIDSDEFDSPSLIDCYIRFKHRKRLGTVQKLISEEARWERVYHHSVEDHIARMSGHEEFEEYGGDDKEPANKKPRKRKTLEKEDSDGDDIVDCKTSSVPDDRKYLLHWGFTLRDYSEEDLQRIQSLHPSEADRVAIGIDPGQSDSTSLLDCYIRFKRRKRLSTIQKLISEEARWEGVNHRGVEDHIARLSSYAEFEEYGGDDKEPTNKKPRKIQVPEEDNEEEEEEEHSDSDDLLDFKASSLTGDRKYRNWSFTLRDYSEADVQRIQSLYPSQADRVVIGIDPGESRCPSMLDCYISFNSQKRLRTVQKFISEEARWERVYYRGIEDRIARLSGCEEFEEYGGDGNDDYEERIEKFGANGSDVDSLVSNTNDTVSTHISDPETPLVDINHPHVDNPVEHRNDNTDCFPDADAGTCRQIFGMNPIARCVLEDEKRKHKEHNTFLGYLTGFRSIKIDHSLDNVIDGSEAVEGKILCMGTTFELASSRIVEDESSSSRYCTRKTLRCFYVAVEGPGLSKGSIKECFAKFGNFEKLTTRKAVARLELFTSPLREFPDGKYAYELPRDYFEDIEECGHEGSGFIAEDLLWDLLGRKKNDGDPKINSLRTTSIQVRIFIPKMGIYKGMLVKKRMTDRSKKKIQLPSSMKKVEASIHPERSDKAYLVICMAGQDGLKSLDANDVKHESAMITRLLSALTSQPRQIMNYFDRSFRENTKRHSWVRGLSDPTGSIPPNHVFISGVNKKVLGDHVFITRSPCIRASDGRRINVVSAKPPNMELDVYKWLNTLSFGVVIFGFPLKGKKPAPTMIAGGDLDGDRYFVLWDKAVVNNLTAHTIKSESLPPSSSQEIRQSEVSRRDEAWFRKTQTFMTDGNAVAINPLIGILYKESGKVADRGKDPALLHVPNLKHPDAVAFADAFTQALESGKHGTKIILPLHLWADIPARYHKHLRTTLDPRQPVRLLKHFLEENVPFEGEVTEHRINRDDGKTHFTVKFEDGDMEEMTYEELMPCIALFNTFEIMPVAKVLSFGPSICYFFTANAKTLVNVAKTVGCEVDDIITNDANIHMHGSLQPDHQFQFGNVLQLRTSLCDKGKLKVLKCPIGISFEKNMRKTHRWNRPKKRARPIEKEKRSSGPSQGQFHRIDKH